MLNWQGWAANFLGWGDASPILVPSTLKPAGRAKKRRVVVEIDGKMHAVATAEEAHEILETVRDKVQERAIKAVAKAIAKPDETVATPPAPRVSVRGEGPDIQRIQAQVDQFNAHMQAIQAEAMARYTAAMAELDDEDAIIALL